MGPSGSEIPPTQGVPDPRIQRDITSDYGRGAWARYEADRGGIVTAAIEEVKGGTPLPEALERMAENLQYAQRDCAQAQKLRWEQVQERFKADLEAAKRQVQEAAR